MWKINPFRVPYIEDEIWGSSPRIKLKEGMLSKINFAQFPREPLTAKSATLHKGATEYTTPYTEAIRAIPKKH